MAASTEAIAQQFLGFQLSPQNQALVPVQQLTEILPLTLNQIVPIPDVPTGVMGVCNWRGDVLWLADLGYLLGFEPLYTDRISQSNYRAIVVQHHNTRLGLVVRQVAQMIWLNPAQIQPITSTQMTPELLECLTGYWLDPQGQTVLVLDGATLANFFQSRSH